MSDRQPPPQRRRQNDGAGKMAAKALAEATKADGAAKAMAAREKEREKEARE